MNETRAKTNTRSSTRAFWICAVIAALSAIVSASFSVAALIGAGRQDQYAMYAGSRSIALLIVTLASISARSRAAVMTLALTMALVQGFDAVIGLIAHDAAKTYGPLILSVAGLASLVAALRSTPSRE